MGVVVIDLKGKDGVSPVLSKIQAGAKSLTNRLNTLQGTLARVGTAALVKGFAQAGVEAERTGKRLKLLSEGYNETAKLQALASKAAEKFSIGTTAAASAATDLYGRLRPMGISLDEIGTVFNGVNVAASKMNLSAADTEGVMLQLSQALGSGTLQGDEFRSIMERLPAIGQAVADSMGVQVSQLKTLSSQGKITTAEIIKALEGLAGQDPPQADAYKQFNKAMADLSTTMGTELLPAITPIVQALGNLVGVFGKLPGPVKTFTAGVLGLGAAFVVLAPAAAAVGPALAAIGALGLGAKLAALAPIVASIGSALSGLLPIIAGVFTGPVGWATLLVAAGAAIYAFRDEIGEALRPIGNLFTSAFRAVNDRFLAPIKKAFVGASRFIHDKFVAPFKPQINKIVTNAKAAFGNIFRIVTEPYRQAWQFIQGSFIAPAQSGVQHLVAGIGNAFSAVYGMITRPFQQAYNFVVGIVSGILNMVNRALRALASIGGGGDSGSFSGETAAAGAYWSGGFQAFAKGGMVKGPTLGLIGEGGEPEYIIPQSKAAGFAANFLSGKRGTGAIPGFADGGVVAPSSASVSIQTGPVTQMGGQNYVTMQDMSQAVQAGVEQTLQFLMSDGTVRAGVGFD